MAHFLPMVEQLSSLLPIYANIKTEKSLQISARNANSFHRVGLRRSLLPLVELTDEGSTSHSTYTHPKILFSCDTSAIDSDAEYDDLLRTSTVMPQQCQLLHRSRRLFYRKHSDRRQSVTVLVVWIHYSIFIYSELLVHLAISESRQHNDVSCSAVTRI